jgi:hypothetical protein
VTFSDRVIANGFSYINLLVGSRLAKAMYFGTDSLGNATVASAPSTDLFYLYTVRPNDTSDSLDYADEYSMFAGYTATHGVAYIKRASMNPTADANLVLPRPGSLGSVSYSSRIVIDGSSPVITAVSITNSDGAYTIKDTIEIIVSFSAPIVVVAGIPSIRLNVANRVAMYTSGSGSSSLFFSFSPQPGDFAQYLDYYSDRGSFYSTAATFLYNGASILAKSANPVLPAEMHFNPPGGYLTGTTALMALAGNISFTNLSITRPGPMYRLHYRLNGTSIRVSQDVNVSFSSEYELRPLSGRVNDHIGSSVAIDGTTAVIGAPNTPLLDTVRLSLALIPSFYVLLITGDN